MKCPYCGKVTSKMYKDGRIYCAWCGALLEHECKNKPQPTLRCPRCGEYTTKDYCPHCGYEFKPGRDY